MSLVNRFVRGAGAAKNTRALCTSSLRNPRSASPSRLSRPQRAIIPQTSSCRTAKLSCSSPFYLATRQQSTTRPPKPLTDGEGQPMSKEDKARMEARRDQEPAYLLTFTCKPCGHRSTHRITKHGYHKGTVLIACPECSNRHLMSDHLKIFSDKPITLQDILAEKNQKLTKGTMRRGDPKGDMEWWGEDSAEQGSHSAAETTSSAETPEKS